MPGIYVEIDIRCSMEDLWEKTQTPRLHQQWDLRFTDIEYLPRPDPTEAQRFLYKTRIGFGLNIAGEGESIGTYESNGSRTSALKFWSADPKSLIRQGSGYWQYIPIPAGIRFLTWYDYTTRFGMAGRLLDTIVFRPMLGWATAWSFDRLRLWLENGRDPAVSLRQSGIYGIARCTVAFAWVYHGLVPKLLFAHPDEFEILVSGGFSELHAKTLVMIAAVVEITLGLSMLIFWKARSLFVVTMVLMIVALLSVAVSAPGYLVAAFNPVTLNILIVALSVIGMVSGRDLASAGRCKRRKAES